MFPNIDSIKDIQKFVGDPSGNSLMDEIFFELDNEYWVRVWCSNYDETYRIKMGWSEGLTVMIMSPEINEWLSDL